MRNRLSERSRVRAREAVDGRLGAGEEIEVLLFAVTRPSVWLEAVISPLLVMLPRTWYGALTNRRLFLIPPRVEAPDPGIEWEEPRGGIRVERYGRGLLMGSCFFAGLPTTVS